MGRATPMLGKARRRSARRRRGRWPARCGRASAAPYSERSRDRRGIGRGEIDGRRHDAVADGEHTGECRERACRSDQMSDHRFRAGNRDPVGVFAERKLDCRRFRDVAEIGAGGMCGEVIDVGRERACTFQRTGHRQRDVPAGRLRCGDVVGIRCRRASRGLCQDGRAAPDGMRFDSITSSRHLGHTVIAVGRNGGRPRPDRRCAARARLSLRTRPRSPASVALRQPRR